ncbi:unnamed protein product [Ectocarpus sp. 6 AP-2014]
MPKSIQGVSWLGPPSARLAKLYRERGNWLGGSLKKNRLPKTFARKQKEKTAA